MVVWLASYPRSGNTFLRIVLHRMYGVATSTVYARDGVAERVGSALIGAGAEARFVKTHRRARGGEKAICLVRDGRDAIVSWARLRAAECASTFEAEVRAQLTGPHGPDSTGGWGENVLSWLALPESDRAVIRYADLVARPVETVRRAVDRLVDGLRPVERFTIPTFAELRRVDDGFFRRGITGSHRDELPDDLHELFWADAANAAAMRELAADF